MQECLLNNQHACLAVWKIIFCFGCFLQKMGKKNRSSAKADKGKPSFQDQLKIKDLVKNLFASKLLFIIVMNLVVIIPLTFFATHSGWAFPLYLLFPYYLYQ